VIPRSPNQLTNAFTTYKLKITSTFIHYKLTCGFEIAWDLSTCVVYSTYIYATTEFVGVSMQYAFLRHFMIYFSLYSHMKKV